MAFKPQLKQWAGIQNPKELPLSSLSENVHLKVLRLRWHVENVHAKVLRLPWWMGNENAKVLPLLQYRGNEGEKQSPGAGMQSDYQKPRAQQPWLSWGLG